MGILADMVPKPQLVESWTVSDDKPFPIMPIAAVAGMLVFTYRGSMPARRALIGYFAVLVALEVGWFAIAPTAPWLEVVRWFRGLPLT